MTRRLLLSLALIVALLALGAAGCADPASTSTSIRIEGLENPWQLEVQDGLRLGNGSGLVVTGEAKIRSNEPIVATVEGLPVIVGPDEVLVDGHSYGPVARGQLVTISADEVTVDDESRGAFPPDDT